MTPAWAQRTTPCRSGPATVRRSRRTVGRRQQPLPKLLHHRLRDVVLYREDVVELAHTYAARFLASYGRTRDERDENALEEIALRLSGAVMTLFQKTVKGTLFGNSNPMRDITKILDLYRAGSVKLDELVTKKYKLDQINEGFDRLARGEAVRQAVVF